MAKTIGFIGLGRMGGAIVANLLAAGYSVVGCDTVRKRVRELEALGGEGAASPEEAAARSDLLMLSVPWDADVEQVLLGKKGGAAWSWSWSDSGGFFHRSPRDLGADGEGPGGSRRFLSRRAHQR
jgi:hypothetical protein